MNDTNLQTDINIDIDQFIWQDNTWAEAFPGC